MRTKVLGLLLWLSMAGLAGADEMPYRQVPGESQAIRSHAELARMLFDEGLEDWGDLQPAQRLAFVQSAVFVQGRLQRADWQHLQGRLPLAALQRLLLQTDSAPQPELVRAAPLESALDLALACALQLAGPDCGATLAIVDIQALFQAQWGRSLVRGDLAALARLDLLGALLEARGALDCRARLRWQAELARAGRFEHARALQRPDDCPKSALPVIPPVPLSPALLHFSGGAAVQAGWQAVDLLRFTGVIVQSSPGCGFSERATEQLRADPRLNALLGTHALWVGVDFEPADYAAWNHRNAPQRLLFLSDARGWPFRGAWRTPVFHFMKNGRVVSSKSGWHRDDDNLGELRRGVAQLGL